MSTSVYIETTIPSAYFETRTDRYAVGNCRHLANPNKLWQMQVLNGKLGLPTPHIVTPATFLTREKGRE